jgi:hypothetical protein
MMKVITVVISVAAALLTGCASSGSRPAVTPAVTHTVIEWKTQTITSPGPTVTKTVYATASPSASSGPPAAAGANEVITRFSGTGTQNTPAFTTPDSWHLSWSYWGCPSGTSNFQVTEYNTDGTLDPNGVSVNELGTGRGPVATYAYGDAGTHYLSVNTEGCNWSLVPVTG